MRLMLHTTGCPNCRVLERKLEAAGLEYDINSDVESLQRLNIMSVPILQIDEETFLGFGDAIRWVNAKKG